MRADQSFLFVVRSPWPGRGEYLGHNSVRTQSRGVAVVPRVQSR
jgi:hypothetical protein